jgi:hypothetical protein
MKADRAPRACLGALLVLVGVTACGPTNFSLRDNLAARASFDLNCPKDQLSYVPLSENEMFITSYGVTGCGQRAAYLLAPGNAWTLDARSEDKAAKEAPPAASPPPPPELGPPPTLGDQKH